MVLRLLMRYLANNEQLIQRMAESYPMRRAAQMVVSLMYRTKSLAREQGLHEMTPERFKWVSTSINKIIELTISSKLQVLRQHVQEQCATRTGGSQEGAQQQEKELGIS